ncbi:hypothetical protein ETU10_08360 [Apibacter muscae]|uniref:hypothetical protein n=1 Tax=Apibacter muscae TaxID=2509004 RepID=UPI0011AC8A1D|nr:hypothetical protein [Apibacter muscae]TWP23098.1 hypothetical protein ETU10_08360 [Apibacter muscae]
MKKLLFLFGLLFIITCSSDDNNDGCKETWNITRYYEFPPDCNNEAPIPSTYDKEFDCSNVKDVKEGDVRLDTKLSSCGAVYIRFNKKVN